MRSLIFRKVTQNSLVVTDVSEETIGPILKGQSVWTSYPKEAGNYQSTLTY